MWATVWQLGTSPRSSRPWRFKTSFNRLSARTLGVGGPRACAVSRPGAARRVADAVEGASFAEIAGADPDRIGEALSRAAGVEYLAGDDSPTPEYEPGRITARLDDRLDDQ